MHSSIPRYIFDNLTTTFITYERGIHILNHNNHQQIQTNTAHKGHHMVFAALQAILVYILEILSKQAHGNMCQAQKYCGGNIQQNSISVIVTAQRPYIRHAEEQIMQKLAMQFCITLRAKEIHSTSNLPIPNSWGVYGLNFQHYRAHTWAVWAYYSDGLKEKEKKVYSTSQVSLCFGTEVRIFKKL
ncbi:hypothetical protein ACJX0J_021626 [Zea mays]